MRNILPVLMGAVGLMALHAPGPASASEPRKGRLEVGATVVAPCSVRLPREERAQSEAAKPTISCADRRDGKARSVSATIPVEPESSRSEGLSSAIDATFEQTVVEIKF